MVAVRLHRALVDERQVDLVAWRGQVRAGLPVGRHDECGGDVYGEATPLRIRGVLHLSMRCGRCGHDAGMPATPAPPEPVAAAA
jgi:hypothetical protein